MSDFQDIHLSKDSTKTALLDSEARLAGIIDSAMDAIVSVDDEQRIIVFNRAAERMFLCSAENAIGQKLEHFIPERFRNVHASHINRFGETGVSTREMASSRSIHGMRSNGEEFPIEASISQVKAGGRKVFTVIMRDVTERERAAAVIREREHQLAEAQRISHIGSWSWDLVTNTLSWSDELFRIFGLEPSEAAPSYEELKRDFIHPDDIEFVDSSLEHSFATGETFDFHYRLRRPNGDLRVLHARGEGEMDEAGKSIRFFGTALDVTERKKAEDEQGELIEKIVKQRQQLKTFVASVPGIVWETTGSPDRGQLVTFVSEHVETMLGYSVDEWLSVPNFWLRIVHPDDRQRLEREIAKQFSDTEGQGHAVEFRWIAKDGSVSWVQSRSTPVLNDAGQAVGLRGVTVDITDRKLAEESVRRSEERYRLFFMSNPMPMWVYSLDSFRFLEVNDAAIRHYGYTRDEFLSMSILDIRTPEDADKLKQSLAQIDSPFGETRTWTHRTADGSSISVEVTAHSLDFNGVPARLVLANDVTVRRNLEEQLRQAQKMEAIGMLAGGVAHDFNNLLTVINGYSQMLQLQLEANDPARGSVEQILEAGERAATLTGQLLAFGRRQVLQPRVIDLNEVVTNVEKMLRRLIGEDIELRIVLESDLGRTKADPGQVEHSLFNLVVNARDAMPYGGQLTLETKNVYLDEEYARAHISVEPGYYVMIGVSDTGIGMDPETRARIFEPFFSTKEPGRGTGLGLSTTFGTVKQSGGNIWVYSEPGKGTTFKIYLPRVEQDLPVYVGAPEKLFDFHGTETILLAEDEKIVRDLALSVLEMYGYNVLTAESGFEALDIWREHKSKIDLLITDVIMPGMSGRELADHMSQLRPDVKILYMSGYTDNAIVHHGVLDEKANFIQKPFSTEGLARKIREVLNDT